MKAFNTMANVGKVRYLVNFHDGVKTHQDGSPFFDLRTFGRKQDMQRFELELKAAGYVEARVDEVQAAQRDEAYALRFKEAQRLQDLKARYRSRKGYAAVVGREFVFARKDAIGKAVAFFDGPLGRDAYKKVLAEVQSLGLDWLTVLVNGVVTYSGAGFTAIRVDAGYEASFTAEDIDKDFMADVRLAKKLQRNASRPGM